MGFLMLSVLADSDLFSLGIASPFLSLISCAFTGFLILFVSVNSNLSSIGIVLVNVVTPMSACPLLLQVLLSPILVPCLVLHGLSFLILCLMLHAFLWALLWYSATVLVLLTFDYNWCGLCIACTRLYASICPYHVPLLTCQLTRALYPSSLTTCHSLSLTCLFVSILCSSSGLVSFTIMLQVVLAKYWCPCLPIPNVIIVSEQLKRFLGTVNLKVDWTWFTLAWKLAS